ncbi:hypothetical protein CTZ27_22845 [Streptomyces griseocarneus]|nr:hypothetical protein CTZ27_22845 [Streptomyces griseocarneus]
MDRTLVVRRRVPPAVHRAPGPLQRGQLGRDLLPALDARVDVGALAEPVPRGQRPVGLARAPGSRFIGRGEENPGCAPIRPTHFRYHPPGQKTGNEQDRNVKYAATEVRSHRKSRPGLPEAFFLDRDGTLNEKPPPGEYITSPRQLTLLPGAAAAVRRINAAARPAILVTNQRGVARGLMSESDLAAVQNRLTELLREHGAFLDACYCCVHEKGDCHCRKPSPGLLTRAAGDFPHLDLRNTVMIGDTETDVLAGRAAGTATVRLTDAPGDTAADLVAPDLRTAVDLLLKSPAEKPPR